MTLLRDDRGLSLVETLVTATLVLVVVALTTTTYVTGLRTTSTSAARADATITLSDAVDAVTRALRTAVPAPDGSPAFEAATQNDLTFWAALETSCSAPVKQRFFVDAATRELVWDATTPGQPTRRRVLVSHVDNDDLFAYWAAVRDPGAPDAAPTLEPLPTLPLTGADRDKVRAVDVSMTVTSAGSRAGAPAVRARDRAFLVNANAYLRGGKPC